MIRRAWEQARQTLGALHRDEQGAEGIEKLLIVAAVVLPILLLLIVFRDRVSEWFEDIWGDVRDDADYTAPDLPG